MSIAPKKLNIKLKVAVDAWGAIHFLEEFPKEEQYEGLNDILVEFSGEVFGDDLAGLYKAALTLHKSSTDDDYYLEIDSLEKFK